MTESLYREINGSTELPEKTDRPKPLHVPMDVRSHLFIIKQRGRNLFWNNSTEHGCGWNQGWPKQSFSKSELANEIRSMIDREAFTDVEVLQLAYRQ